MAKKKGNNPYAKQIRNMNQMGGNHQAQTTQGILQEGRKSYKATIDQKLGTQHATNPYAKDVAMIKQDLGKGGQAQSQAPATPKPKSPER